jgi:pimeloyl-ACP methyl ester carboxylesterase
VALLATGCAATRADHAASIARAAGMRGRTVAAGAFRLQVYERIRTPGDPVVVYIEGDGRAWLTPSEISRDPTPTDPLALRLAAADPAPNVVYIARPCQYLDAASLERCDKRYWSSARYGRAVIDSVAAASGDAMARAGSHRLELVGYSGGGTVAALVAAQRHDVRRLITVAANLDLAAWTGLHRLTPLTSSLDPLDFRDKLRALPQTHLAGEDDPVVPPSVIRSYAAKLGADAAADLRIMPGFTHDCCWADAWPLIIAALRRGESP